MAVFMPRFKNVIERHCLILFNYIIQSTSFPELHDAFEGGIVVVAVQK